MGDDSMRDQPGFFDIDDRLTRLRALWHQLGIVRVAVDFETFRPQLNAALSYSNGSQGGRFYQTALFGLIWTVDRFRRGLCLRHGAWVTFFAGSGGGEGAMPRRCVSGTAIVGCCRRDWRGRFSRSLAQCRWCE